MNIKYIDTTMPKVAYQTLGSVGFDLYSRITMYIEPRKIARIPLNVVVKIPDGCMLFLKDRSSTASMGLLATAGIVDQDYCGNKDELLFQVYNYTNEIVCVEKGRRIAQAILVSVVKPDLNEVPTMIDADRGGFGSTGK